MYEKVKIFDGAFSTFLEFKSHLDEIFFAIRAPTTYFKGTEALVIETLI